MDAPQQDPTVPHVVIVGAGFAGLTAARRLDRAAARRPLRITLVDRHNHHTFQPLLYQVATAGLQPQDVGHSVRGVFGAHRLGRRRSRVTFRQGTVTGVDREARSLTFAAGPPLAFDHLVLAAGAVTADHGIPGIAQHGFGLKTLHDATTLRDHLLTRFERAEADPTRIDGGELTFVVAGGGPTGVEVAGAIAELVSHPIAKDHPDLDLSRVRIVLVEMLDTLLPPYSERLRRYTQTALEERGVDVRLGVGIQQAAADHVVLTDGSRIETRTLIWSAGVTANPLAQVLGVATGRGGRIHVDDRLRVPQEPGWWVVGDLAAATDRAGDLLPQLAPVAIQQGKHVADGIVSVLQGRQPAPFRFVDKGTMATIGRHDAVVELPFGLRFGGPLAWVAWLFLHLMYLVGFRNRVAVFLSWAWNYLTWDRAARVVLNPSGTRDGDGSDRSSTDGAGTAAVG